jgi:hypothetical protein
MSVVDSHRPPHHPSRPGIVRHAPEVSFSGRRPRRRGGDMTGQRERPLSDGGHVAIGPVAPAPQPRYPPAVPAPRPMIAS